MFDFENPEPKSMNTVLTFFFCETISLSTVLRDSTSLSRRCMKRADRHGFGKSGTLDFHFGSYVMIGRTFFNFHIKWWTTSSWVSDLWKCFYVSCVNLRCKIALQRRWGTWWKYAKLLCHLWIGQYCDWWIYILFCNTTGVPRSNVYPPGLCVW